MSLGKLLQSPRITICVHTCIYQIKCLYCESLTDKSQLINAVTISGGTLIIPSRAKGLETALFCRKFVPVTAAGALTGFDGPDQPQLGLCPHPTHGPSPFKLSLGVFTVSACVAEVLLSSSAAAMPLPDRASW